MSDIVKIVISFDAEFSINGAFANPNKNIPCADSIFAPNDPGPEGLKDILTILSKHNVAATFFTEALNSHYFGSGKMKRYVQQMLEYQQDIQLHTHPCWSIFKDKAWKNIVSGQAIPDNFINSNHEAVIQTLTECLAIFKEWGAPRPTSFRAGNLETNIALYSALNETGFITSSNVGLPIYTPTEKELQIQNKTVMLNNIAEYPVTTYKSMGIRDKALTITGCSFTEMKSVLKQCQKNNIRQVIILTHIHEFIKTNATTQEVRQNRVNLKRLDQRCHFINNNKDSQFTTFGRLANDKSTNSAAENDSVLKTSLASGLWTIFQNQVNDRLWRY